jgi:ubiquinone/menaquinone biosynthesis C-methylase UbiE
MTQSTRGAAECASDSAFDVLASEYYDSDLHPTCSNFRTGSMLLLSRWIVDGRQDLCDVGCGNSVLAEIVGNHSWQPASLLLTDSSAAMLEHSRGCERLGAKLMIAQADELPFPDCSIDLLVASLGDPYNEASFWREARRVLRKDGCVVYSTPSPEWASSFRGGLGRAESNRAEFVLADGRKTWIPSIIYPEPVQRQMIESAGLNVEDVKGVSIQELTGVRLSPKLSVLHSPSSPVVSGYLARKRSER